MSDASDRVRCQDLEIGSLWQLLKALITRLLLTSLKHNKSFMWYLIEVIDHELCLPFRDKKIAISGSALR